MSCYTIALYSKPRYNKMQSSHLGPLIQNDGLVLGRKLGSGSFGTVYEGYLQSSPDTHFAVKVFKSRPDFVEELSIAQAITGSFGNRCNPHLICPFKFVDDGKRMYIIYRLAAADLTKFMKDRNIQDSGFFEATPVGHRYDPKFASKIDDITRYNFINTMITTLEELDRLRISHRDIKPDNVFVFGSHAPYEFVAGDLGMLCSHPNSPIKGLEPCSDARSWVGTRTFIHPAILENKENPRDKKEHGKYRSQNDVILSDIYATGVMIYTFLTGYKPEQELEGGVLLHYPRDLTFTVSGRRIVIPRGVIDRLVNTMVFSKTYEAAVQYKAIWAPYKDLIPSLIRDAPPLARYPQRPGLQLRKKSPAKKSPSKAPKKSILKNAGRKSARKSVRKSARKPARKSLMKKKVANRR